MLGFVENYAGLFIFPTMALFLSLVFTYLCIRILPKLGYIDKPGGRHIHEKPIPRGGGIAVILAFFISFGCFMLDSRLATETTLLGKLLLPALIMTVLGLLDDRFELGSWLKLGVQIIVAIIVWSFGEQEYFFGRFLLPWYISLPFTVVWVIGIINAFNLIDGLDGLASGLAIVSSCCMAVWFLMVGTHGPEAVCMLIIAGACLGFLRYNFHPAKIFLGDTGSTFLGLVFAVIGLSSIDRAVTFTSLLLPLLAIGVPLFDVFLAIWRRSSRKLLDPNAGGIMDGDQDHLHHRLLRETHKQTMTALVMYLLGCGFSAIALLIILFKDSAPAIAFVILLVAVLIVVRRLAVVELFDSAQLIRRGLSKPHRGVLVTMTHPFIDFLIVAVATVVSCWVMTGELPMFQLFLIYFVPVVIALCVSKVYRVYWLRAGLYNYWHLALMVLVGSVISVSLSYWFFFVRLNQEFGVDILLFLGGGLLFTLFNISFIELERFMLNYMENFLFRKLYLQRQPTDRLCRTLVYGGGLNCRLYINYLACTPQREEEAAEIIGIIDDDVALHGLLVYGYKVLGGVEDLAAIYERHPFEKIMIATDSASRKSMEELLNFCETKNIRTTKFLIAETTDRSSFFTSDEVLPVVPVVPEN